MLDFLFAIESTLNDNILNHNLISRPRLWLQQNTHLWLRPLVVVGVLLFSAALPFVPQRFLMLIPVLLFGVVAVVLFMRWPPLGLVALMGTLVIPINGPSGSNATMALVALLLGLWLLDMIVHRREVKLVSSRPILPLLLFVLVAHLSFIVGQLPWYTFALQSATMGAQVATLSIFILSAAAFLVVAHQVRDLRWLEWMTWAFLAVGSMYILLRAVGLWQYANKVISSGSTGSLFWVWMVTLSFSQAAYNQHLRPHWRALLGGLTLATLYVALFQGWAWNSGWTPPLASLVTILCVGTPRLGLLGILAGIAGLATKLQKVIGLIMVGDNAYSLGTRIDAWLIVWDITKVSPILGLGPANYRAYTPLFRIRGWAVEFNSHMQYMDLIAQTGLLGLACFFWFFGAVGWLAWKTLNRVPDGFARAYVIGALGGVVGTLTAAAFGDWVLPFFYNIGLNGFRASVLSWVFLGGLVALEQMYNHQN